MAMKIAYFDCSSGISGDMTVAAFLDAGLKLSTLKKRLHNLGLKGYTLTGRKISKNGISATKFDVHINENSPRGHTDYKEIKKLIGRSNLSVGTKKLSLLIFENLAKAEARIHGRKRIEDMHFHEVGAVDSIVDIVSTAIAVKELAIERFYCLNVKIGSLPAPASLELLKDKPLSFLNVGHELVTPTGAAILKTLVNDFRARPDIEIEAIGYGAGTFETRGRPNLLRVIIGSDRKETLLRKDEILVIETNIDDMNPVSYEYLIEKLFEGGALDVYLTSVYMKKTRPGVLLTVLAKWHLLDTLTKVIMRETTSSGVRYYKSERKILERSIRRVGTKYGSVRVKLNTGPDEIRTISPEYEDCRRLARKTGLPFKTILNEVNKEIILK